MPISANILARLRTELNSAFWLGVKCSTPDDADNYDDDRSKYIQGWNILKWGQSKGEGMKDYSINLIGSIGIYLEENKFRFIPTYILEWLKMKWKRLEVVRE